MKHVDAARLTHQASKNTALTVQIATAFVYRLLD